MSEVPIVRSVCPLHCGWFRDWTDTHKWRGSKILHPLYGTVTQEQLVNIELATHNCQLHAEALARLETVGLGPKFRKKNYYAQRS